MTHPHGARSRGAGSLVERFLGRAEAAGGPLALLGLDPREVTDERVIASLESQLTRVATHIQGETPEADEVRLALHAAAAQLLDPRMRAALLRAHGSEPAPRVVAPRPARAASTSRAVRRLEHDAILVLGAAGGWNRRALHRLALLARARGAPPGEVVEVMRSLAHNRAGGVGAPRAPGVRLTRVPGAVRPGGSFLSSQEPEGGKRSRAGRLVLASVGGAVLLVIAFSLLVIVLSPGGGKEPAPGDAQGETGAPARAEDGVDMAGGAELFPWQGPAPAKPPAETPEASVPAPPPSLAEALHGLEEASEGLTIDPETALASFRASFQVVASEWCRLAPGQARAAQHDVVEFVYRAGFSPTVATRAVQAIGAPAGSLSRAARGADEMWPAIWSLGMLARLAAERDLASSAGDAARAAIADAVGASALPGATSFQAGAALAVADLALRLQGVEETPSSLNEHWTRWRDGAIAAAEGEPARVSGTLLDTLDQMLASGRPPGESPSIQAAITVIVRGCDWSDGAPARAWTVRAFDDQRLGADDIHALTSAIALRSGAPGIDPGMILALRASPDERLRLRDRYAAAWDISTDGPAPDELDTDWRRAIEEVDGAAGESGAVPRALSRAAMLSRLNHVAELRWRGDMERAGVLLDEFDRPVRVELARIAQAQAPDSQARGEREPMGRWSLRYLSAQRDFEERLKLLNEAGRTQLTDTVDAEVVVTEAIRGTPAQARAAAREALHLQRPSPRFTLALLELAPSMPRTVQNAELVATLTLTPTISIKDPAWRFKTRRALVQAALEQLAGEGELGIIDSLARVLAESYAERASTTLAPSAEDRAPDAQESAAIVRARMEREARSIVSPVVASEVDQILLRHAARFGLAEGPVQRFAAEQFAAFELMGVVVGSERPRSAEEIARVRAEVHDARRAARDVVEQVESVERGIARLWAVRFAGESQ